MQTFSPYTMSGMVNGVTAISPEVPGVTWGVGPGGWVMVVQERADFTGVPFGPLFAAVPVRHKGAPPDLFGEGRGAVVEGSWSPEGYFRATHIMAKHYPKK